MSSLLDWKPSDSSGGDSKNLSSYFDSFLGVAKKAGEVYSQVELAKRGVATPQPTIIYQTTGANDPATVVGQPAAVQSADPLVDRLANIAQDGVNKAAMVAGANELRKSLPYLVGMVALGITIYLLTKK